MKVSLKCRRIVGGFGIGKAIITEQPINFLSMVDVSRGIIKDPRHHLFRSCLKDSVLVFPRAVGSSVGSYSIYALKVNCVAPAAIICSGKTDLTTASGCAISNIALVDMLDTSWSSVIRDGIELEVDANNRTVNLPKQTI